MTRVVIVVLSLLLVGCAAMQPSVDIAAAVDLRNASGATVGTAWSAEIPASQATMTANGDSSVTVDEEPNLLRSVE